jgi:hypothetical protein
MIRIINGLFMDILRDYVQSHAIKVATFGPKISRCVHEHALQVSAGCRICVSKLRVNLSGCV